MRKIDIFSMPYSEVCYTELLCAMYRFNDKLEKVTLCREKAKNGKMLSVVTCKLVNKRTKYHMKFSLLNEDYIWLLNSIQTDYPDVPFEDLTPDDLKLVKE